MMYNHEIVSYRTSDNVLYFKIQARTLASAFTLITFPPMFKKASDARKYLDNLKTQKA